MNTRTTTEAAMTTERHRPVPGLRLRPYAGEPDLVEITRIENAEAEADQMPERVSLEEEAARFGHPNDRFEPVRDVTIAEVDGRAVAVAYRSWVDTTDNLREYRVHGAVEPAWRRRGVGSVLLADNERRMRELAAGQETANPRFLGSWTGDSQPGAAALLAGAGYEPVRWFFDMTRPSLDDVPDVPLPDDLELRPITMANVRAVWQADLEAFRDHWGGFDGSEAMFQRWMASPSTDLSLWVVAFDGDEVAGGIINSINDEENAALGINRGWLASVFTRRPWRRRGVARALIARSLGLLRDRGATSAALGVDADNPSGALGLYEDAGFAVTYRSTAWRKPL
jgi:GNAT superfamily N-acetyltransferase